MACEKTVAISNMSDVWDDGTNFKTAIKMNVTDTSSASNSRLFDLLKDGVSQFSVDKNGVIQVASDELWIKNSDEDGFGVSGGVPSIYSGGSPVLILDSDAVYPNVSGYDLGDPSHFFTNIYQVTTSNSNPTTSQYPSSGAWGLHVNTSNNKVFLSYNTGTGIKSLDLDTTTVTGGGSVDTVDYYTNATPVPITLGGISSGTTFNNVPVADILNDLLYPFLAPTFFAFSFNQTSSLEIGQTITAGAKDFSWSTTNSSNVQANSISIRDVTNNVVLASGLANDGYQSIAISSITNNTDSSHTWRITGTNTQDDNFTRDFTVTWKPRIFYGESALTSLNESQIEALRVNTLKSSVDGTYSFEGGGYKYLCYPTSMGLLTSAVDPVTSFEIALNSPSTVSVTNAYGVTQNYYVYRTTNSLGGSIEMQVST